MGCPLDAYAIGLLWLGGPRHRGCSKGLMRKGKMKSEPINVIAFCGDGGGADMGLSAISATLTHRGIITASY